MNVIRKEITIEAPATKVWDYLTDSEKIAWWIMVENDFQPQVGRDFTFIKSQPHLVRCRVLELVPNRRLVYSWTSDYLSIHTIVSFDLEERGASTHVTLTHSGWDALPADKQDVYDSHANAWQDRFGSKLALEVEGR